MNDNHHIPAAATAIADKVEAFLAVAIDGFLINLRVAQNIPAEMLLRGLAIACGRQLSMRTQHPTTPAITIQVRDQARRDFEATLRKHAPALASTAPTPAMPDGGTCNGVT
jgi:hypothetical protein